MVNIFISWAELFQKLEAEKQLQEVVHFLLFPPLPVGAVEEGWETSRQLPLVQDQRAHDRQHCKVRRMINPVLPRRQNGAEGEGDNAQMPSQYYYYVGVHLQQMSREPSAFRVERLGAARALGGQEYQQPA